MPCWQSVDIRIDNASKHGHGVVEVSGRDAFGAVAMEVSEDGAIAADPSDLFQRGASSGGNALASA
jgi:hypothetical protein